MINAKPLIAISNDANIYLDEKKVPRIISCPAAYSQALALAGAVPILTCEQAPREIEQLCDALVLTGGKDISPQLYHEEQLNDSVIEDEIRSEFELRLTEAFLAAGKPILGICRGSQLLNVLLGGTLYQDLPEQLGFVHHDRELRHFVEAKPGFTLHRLFGPRFRVNSTHHQAVRQLAPGLIETATSPDGVIEGFEHQSRPLWGYQFHPERLVNPGGEERAPNFLPLFEDFVCRVYQYAQAV